MSTDLIDRARTGDEAAFRDLVDPYRHELQLHCYRILGSMHDAEDALQETLLAAWQALPGFEARSSLRTWLYKIATNRCLNARRATRRRPPKEWDVPGVKPPQPTRLGEIVWLEPLPDDLLGGESAAPGPEARYEQRESISLAFITALQLLPPRQLAVLVLRDVLQFRANEVAGMLESSSESVTSALKRARAALHRHRAATTDRELPPATGSAAENMLVEKFVRAYESSDVDALVELLTDDVFVSMPPMPFEYEGKALAREFWSLLFGAGREYRLVPSHANGQPAFGSYVLAADGQFHGTGLFVLTLAGSRICALTRFESTTLSRFGLPRSISKP